MTDSVPTGCRVVPVKSAYGVVLPCQDEVIEFNGGDDDGQPRPCPTLASSTLLLCDLLILVFSSHSSSTRPRRSIFVCLFHISLFRRLIASSQPESSSLSVKKERRKSQSSKLPFTPTYRVNREAHQPCLVHQLSSLLLQSY